MQDKVLTFIKSWAPISDRVVVLPDEQVEQTVEGILTSHTKQGEDRRITGTVIAVGKGRYGESGELIPMESKVGDKVILGKFTGNDYLIDSELTIEKYNGIRGDDQTLICILRQDSLDTTLPSL